MTPAKGVRPPDSILVSIDGLATLLEVILSEDGFLLVSDETGVVI
jgi:hypothetical protein